MTSAIAEPISHPAPTLRLLQRRNPFFLASAACMLLGCLALSGADCPVDERASRSWSLFLTLQTYELLLVGLALGLCRLRRRSGESRMLLGLAAVFALDPCMLLPRLATLDPMQGLIGGIALLGLTTLKLGLVSKVLRLQLPAGLVLRLIAGLTVLQLTPGVATLIADGPVQPTLFVVAWLHLGALVVTLLGRSREVAPDKSLLGLSERTVSILGLVPAVGVGVQLLSLHWVYSSGPLVAQLAPAFAGLALAIVELRRSSGACGSLETLAATPVLGIGWATAAVVGPLSASDVSVEVLGFALTPTRLAIFAAGLVYLRLRQLRGQWLETLLGAACIGLSAGSPTPVVAVADYAGEALVKLGELRPSGARGWGLTGICASFVLLFVGAATSFSAPAEEEEIELIGHAGARS